MRFDSPTEFSITEDDNGFLVAQGVIATAGEKLVYKEGTEVIGESALFENMDSWVGLPVTLNHPRTGLLNPSNTKKHQVGSVTKVWRQDNQLWAKFRVTVKDAIDAVKSGMRGLSAGYRVVMDGSTQAARSNNHLAICGLGRSPSSGIRGDERRDSYDINGESPMIIKFPNGKEIKLDCSDAEYQLLQGQVDALASRADSVEAELVKVSDAISQHLDADEDMPISEKMLKMKMMMDKAKKDGEDITKLQAQCDELKAQSEKDKGKMDSADIDAILVAHEKAQRIDAAIKIRKDDGTIKTAKELMTEAVLKHDKDIKLDGKADGYLEARLDAALEVIDASNVRKQRQDGNGKPNGERKLTVQERADEAFRNEWKETK